MLSVLPDAVVTNAATQVKINVLANDSGTNLTITSFSNPAHGSLVFNGDKSFTYTPSAGFIGDDSFAYTVRDAQGTPANAEVTISVLPNTGTTVATDDVVEVAAGGSVIVPVLANDMTAGDGALQVTAISMPGHGSVNVLPDQTIRYVPQSGFTGIDSFTYTVTDGQGASTGATVTVKVLARNSPPIAAADTFPVEAGQPTVLAVLANDTDPDSGPLQIVGFTMSSHGSLVFNPDKTFTYTPAAGYLGQDQFTYTIRDNRGDSASATVTLNVVEITESPNAIDDHTTTEAGSPVTVDVLANDNLPSGQQITIVAVTLPFRGKLTFNLDKTITYTPNPGFIGTDDFTYTISNGKGGTAKAKVTIEVTAAATAATYANGYGYRRRIVMPTQPDSAVTIEDGVVLVSERGDWLKSSANGGKVTSPAGFDIRFELAAGGKLDHEIEAYEPAAGRLLAWVRLPSWALSDQLQLLLYYGNGAVTADESNPAGVWQGYLARWRLPDGTDATGEGRDLVPQGLVPDSLVGEAARFDGNADLRGSDTSWLVDLSALTMQALIKADASMVGTTNGILVQGSPNSDGANEGMMMRYLAATSTGASNVVHVRVGCLDGNAFTLSSADQQTDKRQLIHGTWLAGNAPDLYLDGVKNTPSRSVARSGRTNITGPLYIGAGWQGLIDEVRLAARSLPAEWITVEARNMLTPELSYGFGHEETIDTVDLPPIAVPFVVSTTSDKFVDIEILSQALDPDGAGGLLLTGISQPSHGMATVVNDLVRYTPNADFVGTDQLTYTVSDGARSASGLIGVTVAAAVASAPSTSQNDSGVVLPSAQRTVNVANQSQFDSALAAAVAGDHIVLANGSYSGPGNWTRSGTQANPIVVRSANLLGARITGSFNPNGSDLILHGLDFQAAVVNVGNSAQANRVRLWRSRWGDMAPSTSMGLRTYRCSDLDVAYCEWTNWGGRGISFGPAAGTQRPRVRRCLFRNTPAGFSQNATEAIQLGFGNADRPIACEALIEFCRFAGWNSDDETVSVKSSGNILRQLSFEGNAGRCGNRMGLNNLYEAITFKGSSGIRIHDKGNLVLGCDVTEAGQGLRIATGNHDADTTMTTNDTPNAVNVHVAGCSGTVTIAHAFTDHNIRAHNTRLRQHSGTVTLASGTHVGTDSQPAVADNLYSWASPLWLTDADVGPTADLG